MASFSFFLLSIFIASSVADIQFESCGGIYFFWIIFLKIHAPYIYIFISKSVHDKLRYYHSNIPVETGRSKDVLQTNSAHWDYYNIELFQRNCKHIEVEREMHLKFAVQRQYQMSTRRSMMSGGTKQDVNWEAKYTFTSWCIYGRLVILSSIYLYHYYYGLDMDSKVIAKILKYYSRIPFFSYLSCYQNQTLKKHHLNPYALAQP